MYSAEGKIYIEEDDQCNSCENYTKGVACPLLMALGEGAVFMEGSLTVEDCGFYKEFKRNLHIV